MDTELDFDPTQYSRLPPYLDTATTAALARKLIAAAPKAPSPGAKRSLSNLTRASQALGSAMAESLLSIAAAAKRPIDLLADRSWSAVEMRLGAWLQIEASEHAEVASATELYQQLFPDRLKFTLLEYGAQWAEAESRISMLRTTGKLALLEKLCGKPFVEELLRCHAAYGVMVGAVAPSGAARSGEEAAKPELGPLRKRVQQAILSYMIQLVAMRMSGDAAEERAAELALRPIDEYREKLSPVRTARKDEPEPEPAPVAGDEPKPT